MSSLVCVTHRHRVTLFVLSNRSCDWYDLLTKGYVNYIIYICISDKPHMGHSHIKTPLICKLYDLDVDWVEESEVLLIQFSKCCLQNLSFSHIHMWPIEFNENMSGIYWYQRFLKHCQTSILYSWPPISPTSKLCVNVWDLWWEFTTVFLYGFE